MGGSTSWVGGHLAPETDRRKGRKRWSRDEGRDEGGMRAASLVKQVSAHRLVSSRSSSYHFATICDRTVQSGSDQTMHRSRQRQTVRTDLGSPALPALVAVMRFC